MATYLSLVNSVLRKLRSAEVTSVSESDYSTLIGDFVNLVKEEMEDAANWDMLRDTVVVTTVSGTWNYALTTADSRAKILDVFNDTEDGWMRPQSSKYMTSALNTSPVVNDSPMYYSVNGVNSSGVLLVDVYPIPNAVESLNFNMVIPESTLSASTDETFLPTRALIHGAWAMAISERGEDGGVSWEEASQRYRKALGDAIALDASHHDDEFIMEVI